MENLPNTPQLKRNNELVKSNETTSPATKRAKKKSKKPLETSTTKLSNYNEAIDQSKKTATLETKILAKKYYLELVETLLKADTITEEAPLPDKILDMLIQAKVEYAKDPEGFNLFLALFTNQITKDFTDIEVRPSDFVTGLNTFIDIVTSSVDTDTLSGQLEHMQVLKPVLAKLQKLKTIEKEVKKQKASLGYAADNPAFNLKALNPLKTQESKILGSGKINTTTLATLDDRFMVFKAERSFIEQYIDLYIFVHQDDPSKKAAIEVLEKARHLPSMTQYEQVEISLQLPHPECTLLIKLLKINTVDDLKTKLTQEEHKQFASFITQNQPFAITLSECNDSGIPIHKQEVIGHNLAAHGIAKLLGEPYKNLIPHGELGFYNERVGLAMEFINGKTVKEMIESGEIKPLLESREFQKQLLILQLLDALMGATDRNLSNIMIELKENGSFKRIVGIDNDNCFGSKVTTANLLDYIKSVFRHKDQALELRARNMPSMDTMRAFPEVKELFLKLNFEDIEHVMRKNLSSSLLEQAISAARDRFTEVQKSLYDITSLNEETASAQNDIFKYIEWQVHLTQADENSLSESNDSFNLSSSIDSAASETESTDEATPPMMQADNEPPEGYDTVPF